MAILKKILPIIMLPVLAGCEEVCTIDTPQEPVLCINSQVVAGEPIEVSVSRTRSYTDNSDQTKVEDATVEVYANGQLQSGSYVPDESDVIRLVAKSKTLGEASAEVKVPNAVPIKDVSWEVYDVKCGLLEEADYCDVRFKMRIRMTIEDPQGDNYYKYSCSTLSATTGGDYDGGYSDSQSSKFVMSDLKYDAEPIFSEHIGVFESIMGGDAYGYTVFTDRQFQGKTYTLNLVYDNCYYRGSMSDVADCVCELALKSISPSYYNWASYTWQRQNGVLADLSDYGYGDPLWGYSNCTTGAGIVVAQSEDEYEIDLADFVKSVISGASSGGN